MRAPHGLLALALALASCDGRARAREGLLRASLRLDAREPAAAPTRRLRRMTESPHGYLRGALAVFVRDWSRDEAGLRASRFAGEATVFSVGDAHVENFGTLVGADGAARFEVNDLDEAAPAPLLWDLRRLAVSLRLAVHREHSPHDADALARALARGYARALAAPDEAHARTARSPLVLDLLLRARRDRDDGDDDRGAPLAAAEHPALAARLLACRAFMAAPRDEVFFTLLDAQSLAGGVSSADATRYALRVRGPSDDPRDDLALELKPLLPRVTPGTFSEGEAPRIRAARANLWTRPDADPSWCAYDTPTGAWQVRGIAPGTLGLRARRVAQATPAEAEDLAESLGGTLAALHRRTLPPSAPAMSAIARDLDGFIEEQRAVSARYAAVALEDWNRLRHMLRARR